jgi:hypothetical protein
MNNNSLVIYDDLGDIINEKQYKILYNRSENKNYIYMLGTDQLYTLNIKDTYSYKDSESIVWPSVEGNIGDLVEIEETWKKSLVERYRNNKGEEIVSIVATENIYEFNNDPNIRSKNFFELMKYAINLGEEKKVWKYFKDKYVKLKLFEILHSMYDISSSSYNEELASNFKYRFSYNIEGSTRVNDLMGPKGMNLILDELKSINKDQDIKDRIDRLKGTNLDLSYASSNEINSIKRKIELMIFDKDTSVYANEYRSILAKDYGYNPRDLSSMSDEQIKTLYLTKMDRERNLKIDDYDPYSDRKYDLEILNAEEQ